MFTGMNAALLVGFFRWAFGTQTGTWRRTARRRGGVVSGWVVIAFVVAGSFLAVAGWGWKQIPRRGGLDRWLPAYVRSRRRRSVGRPADAGRGRPRPALRRRPLRAEARQRRPPQVAAGRVDALGPRLPPASSAASATATAGRRATRSSTRSRSTTPEHLDALAGALPRRLRRGRGPPAPRPRHGREPPRRRSLDFKELLADRHGLLSRDRRTGELAYGFIHGNWALDNSRPDGRWCGVNNELDVLRETGCYADFTLPSAPSPTQTRKINSLYYAVDDPAAPRSHDTGVDVGDGAAAGRIR